MDTRGRKGSLKDMSMSSSDVSDIVSEIVRKSEERLKAFFKDEIKALRDRIESMEVHVSLAQSECSRLDFEVTTIKEVIIKQQMQLENYEKKARAKNLIIHNISEEPLSSGTQELRKDIDKIQCLCEAAMIEFDPEDIVSLQRLGKPSPHKSRPIKLTFRTF